MIAALAGMTVTCWLAVGGLIALLLGWGSGEVLCVELAALSFAILSAAALVTSLVRGAT